MSIWEKLSVEEKVREALGTVTIVNESGHHFGRPYMTAYQLAIKVDRAHPEVAQELKAEVGARARGTASRSTWPTSCPSGSRRAAATTWSKAPSCPTTTCTS
ncbi:hypothetical protein AB0M48_41175 [Lentzea sp. NPDC051208]|uniref:hypothetical protein n=1 Tax=Lentzea sp. NPDC051208 TaxID=3154642 RepID=UPI0034277043